MSDLRVCCMLVPAPASAVLAPVPKPVPKEGIGREAQATRRSTVVVVPGMCNRRTAEQRARHMGLLRIGLSRRSCLGSLILTTIMIPVPVPGGRVRLGM